MSFLSCPAWVLWQLVLIYGGSLQRQGTIEIDKAERDENRQELRAELKEESHPEHLRLWATNQTSWVLALTRARGAIYK
jgi:hypothetical protein